MVKEAKSRLPHLKPRHQPRAKQPRSKSVCSARGVPHQLTATVTRQPQWATLFDTDAEDRTFRKSLRRVQKAVVPRTADPQLWSLIKWSCPGWQRALALSRESPIDIVIGVYADDYRAHKLVDAFAEEVRKHSHRWRTVKAPDCHSDIFYSALAKRFPLLESLEVG